MIQISQNVSMRSLLASSDRDDSSPRKSSTTNNGHHIKSEIQIGSKVVLNDDRVGHVKFVGHMDFTEGLWYGIELIPPSRGTNDGQLAGKRYFTCPKGQGAFVTKYNL